MTPVTRLPRLALAVALATTGCAVMHPPAPLPAPTPAQLAATLTRAEAGAELDAMMAIVEEVHPDPYTVVSRDSLRHVRDALVAAFPGSVDRVTFAIAAQRLLALVGDGHTSVYPPQDELNAFLASGGRTLPFGVTVTAGGLAVSTSLDPAVHAGDLPLRINDHSTDSLARIFGQEIPAELDAWRAARIAGSFALRLWSHGIRAPFTVTLRDAAGAERTATLPGVTREQIDSANKTRGAANAAQLRGGIAYRQLRDRVAYLDFTSMAAQPDRLRVILDSLFARVNADSSSGIVVDLRRNGGGNSALGDMLLTYVSDRPYRGGISKEWKMSARYRAYVASQTAWWVRWLPFSWFGGQARQMFVGPDGSVAHIEMTQSTKPAPNPLRVARPVCVLIGPGTFSSAMLLANSIKQSHLATLVGEPTGEPPNSFGEVYAFQLPRTGLRGQVSSAAFVLDPDTLGARRHGVLPDIAVTRTADDLRAGRDPALDRAQRCAQNANGGAPATP